MKLFEKKKPLDVKTAQPSEEMKQTVEWLRSRSPKEIEEIVLGHEAQSQSEKNEVRHKVNEAKKRIKRMGL